MQPFLDNPPSQGSLGPYEKRTVEFSFAPAFLQSGLGWTHHQGLPSQRSYGLFVKFVHVGAHPLEEEGGGGGIVSEQTCLIKVSL